MSSPLSQTPLPTKVDLKPLEMLVRKFMAFRNSSEVSGLLAAEPMVGGASARRYFRVSLPSGGTAVGMFVPDATNPEEIQKVHNSHRWPFIEVRELLAERGIDVPNLLAEDTNTGWLLLEDLGDDTLANYLIQYPSKKTELYSRAVTDLAKAQRALRDLPEHSVVAGRAFDADLLRWEIDHFREWGLDALGKTLSPPSRKRFDEIADRLSVRIAGWERWFTHRDYQSRNLMVRPNGDLVWIDFQDALLGPRVYDLVALLNDSYQEFERNFVEARLREFSSAAAMSERECEELICQFDLVTVQRKLKDAGRFVFIDRVKKNSSFLRFVTPTIRKVAAALERLSSKEPDMADMAAILHRVHAQEM